MTEPLAVRVPLINPNEPDARLTSLHVAERQAVDVGSPLCVLETTKSTVELAAEGSGFVVGLRAREGDLVRAGETLCWLAETPDWQPPSWPEETEAQRRIPTGLRITEPALRLAQREGLDLEALPRGPLLTEAAVRQKLGLAGRVEAGPGLTGPASRSLVVYGGGGHGKSVIDLVRAGAAYGVVGVIDDGMAPGSLVLGVPVLGGGDALAGLHGIGVHLAANAVGGIGDMRGRVRVFQRLGEAEMSCPGLVHPTAVVEASARVAEGVQIFPHAYVGSQAEVGYGVIVNTGAVVSHDCRLSDYANIAPGALLAGNVRIGEGTLVGMGVTINLNVSVGAWSRVGNGAVIKDDIPEGTIIRAGAVWP